MAKNMMKVLPVLDAQELDAVKNAISARGLLFGRYDIPTIMTMDASAVLTALIDYHSWNPLLWEATAIAKIKAHLEEADDKEPNEVG